MHDPDATPTHHATACGSLRRDRVSPWAIHTFTGPEDGWLVNSHIIELPSQLFVIDAQYTLPFAREVAGYAGRNCRTSPTDATAPVKKFLDQNVVITSTKWRSAMQRKLLQSAIRISAARKRDANDASGGPVAGRTGKRSRAKRLDPSRDRDRGRRGRMGGIFPSRNRR